MSCKLQIVNTPMPEDLTLRDSDYSQAFRSLMHLTTPAADPECIGMGKFLACADMRDVGRFLPGSIQAINSIHNCAMIISHDGGWGNYLYLMDSDLTCNTYPCGYEHLNPFYTAKMLRSHFNKVGHANLPYSILISVISKIPFYGDLNEVVKEAGGLVIQ